MIVLNVIEDHFWTTADWLQSQYQNQNPVMTGIFDLNRHQNWQDQ